MGEDYPLELEKLMRSAGTRIMSDIIRRVRDCSEITRTADWQIDRLNQLGESKKYIKSTIQKALKLSDEQIEEMYKSAAESAHAYNKELYKATGKDYIPYVENAFLQQITAAVASQTKDEFKNITGSLGFAVKRGGLTVFKPIAKYYQSTLDNAVADITSGAFDYNTVIKRTVEEMTRSGLRTVDYASGHSNRIDVAVRRAVLTGLNQLTGQVQEANAEKLGAEKFEVTWHSTARPTHQPWQGRVYTKEELVGVCGLGEVDGLKGANCRHDYFPFIEGISERVYTDEQLEELNRKENEKKAYGDKEYTAYEATQRQRYLETAIRAQRQKIKLLQEGNASEDDIISAKCKYHKLSQEYTNFSKAMDLPQERSRIYSDGLGKVDVKLPKVKKQVASLENMSYNRMRNRNAYKAIPYSKYTEPMTKKHIRRVMKEMGISYGKATVRLVNDKELIGRGLFGYTNPNGKEVQLYPDAFMSREELVKTLGHEKVHLIQLKQYGPTNDTELAALYEKEASESEEQWWEDYKKVINNEQSNRMAETNR